MYHRHHRDMAAVRNVQRLPRRPDADPFTCPPTLTKSRRRPARGNDVDAQKLMRFVDLFQSQSENCGDVPLRERMLEEAEWIGSLDR